MNLINELTKEPKAGIDDDLMCEGIWKAKQNELSGLKLTLKKDNVEKNDSGNANGDLEHLIMFEDDGLL